MTGKTQRTGQYVPASDKHAQAAQLSHALMTIELLLPPSQRRADGLRDLRIAASDAGVITMEADDEKAGSK